MHFIPKISLIYTCKITEFEREQSTHKNKSDLKITTLLVSAMRQI